MAHVDRTVKIVLSDGTVVGPGNGIPTSGGGGDLSRAVILAPNTNNRNQIQSTGNFVTLPLRAQVGQLNSILQCEDTDGALLFQVSPAGLTAVTLCLNTLGTDVPLYVQGVGGQSVPYVQVQNQGFDDLFAIWDPAVDCVAQVYSPTDQSVLAAGSASGTAEIALFSKQNAGAGNPNYLRILQDTSLQWSIPDSNTSLIPRTCQITPQWADNTNGATRGRMILSALNNNVDREGLRVEAGAAAPMVGFLGAAAVVRQAGASATGIAAIIDVNAKAAVSALQTALAAYGLVTSPA